MQAPQHWYRIRCGTYLRFKLNVNMDIELETLISVPISILIFTAA